MVERELGRNCAAGIPADVFLEQAMAALTAGSARDLHRLEKAVPHVSTPNNDAHFVRQHAAFAALLDASARNLRLLGRLARAADAEYGASQRKRIG